MRRSFSFSGIAAAGATILLVAACEGPSSAVAVDDGALFNRSVHATVAQDALLKSVRQATARFNSTTQAIAAGYQADHEHCVAAPGLGVMGYHWANLALVDGVFDPREPEVLLYARGPGGKLRLVGVEYVVIAGPGQDLETDRPHFGSHPFDIGGSPVPRSRCQR
jgi:hypothetical protein